LPLAIDESRKRFQERSNQYIEFSNLRSTAAKSAVLLGAQGSRTSSLRYLHEKAPTWEKAPFEECFEESSETILFHPFEMAIVIPRLRKIIAAY
jgi:hypothetical protein